MVTDFKNPMNNLKLKNILRASFCKFIYDLQQNKINIIKSNESRLHICSFLDVLSVPKVCYVHDHVHEYPTNTL